MKKAIFDKYAKEVAEHFRIKESDLWTKSKKTDITNARYLLFYLCFKRDIIQQKIIDYCEEYGLKVLRSTLTHALKKMEDRVQTDSDYYAIVKRIQESVTI
jgi:chromosomal replication initiation ATPase DnaA